MKIAHKKHPEYKGKSATFWHIITSGREEQNRIPDLRRCERILWPSYILESCIDNCDKILIWENKRKNDKRILIWCKTVEYLIVLAKRKDYVIFWTAYPVINKHTQCKLQKEYDHYIIPQPAPL
jgi:hypothetical protein